MSNAAARFAPALVLAVGFGLVQTTKATRAIQLSTPLEQSIPIVPGYDVQIQRIPKEERVVSAMSDYSARAYSRDSLVAFTTLVSYYESQSRGQSIHSPRNCLPGAGWEIVSGGTAPVVAANERRIVNRYVVKNGPAQAVVYYWYQGRGRVVANEFRVKWNLLRDAALRGHTEEALVRIVVPVRLSAPATNPVQSAANLGASIAGAMIVDVDHALPHDRAM
jgi:EpsI family protein